MAFAKTLMAASVSCLIAGPGFASACSDRITYLEDVMEEAAEASISASSGGQGVAGAREAQAMAEENEAELEEPVVPFQDEEDAEEAFEEAEVAGEGGDLIMQVQAALDEARSLDEEGNAEACEEAVRTVMLDLILN